MRICLVVVALFFLLASQFGFAVPFGFAAEKPVPLGLTVEQAIRKFGPDAKNRLLPYFEHSNVPYPPDHLYLVCLKSEELLLVFAQDSKGKMKQIRSYSIVSNSGVSGPKLKEGDLQIPEGFYKITGLDAMTHLAMWVNYPNAIDKLHARTDRRTNLGGYIQIHAGVYSTGCIVISNDDMAELLSVAYAIGYKNVDLLVAPCNLLDRAPDVDFKKQPKWLPGLYQQIKDELRRFPVAPIVPYREALGSKHGVLGLK
jgi:hypothetical protein